MSKDVTEPGAAIPPPAVPKLRFQMFRTVAALILREIITTYGRSPGGYIWAVAQPVAFIGAFSLAFSFVLRSPPLGTNFILFYTTGFLPLRMFQMLSSNVGTALHYSKPLLGYPRVTFIDAILGRAILVLLTQIIIMVIIYGSIFTWTETSSVVHLQTILECFIIVGFLGAGIGILNCFLFNLFPVWRVLWGIVTAPLILISAVLYIFEDLPGNIQGYLWFNPLVHVTGLMRTGFFSSYTPGYISVTYVMIWAAVPAFFGLLLLRRYGRSILYL